MVTDQEVALERAVAVDPAASATDNAITILERAIEATQKTTKEYRGLLANMRNKRRGH